MEKHPGGSLTAASIQEAVNDARASGAGLRIVGGSHWIDAGRPVDASRILSTASHSGVVDYVPGDLTITVRSGTTLREIRETTAREGQWFPLDPYGAEDGTIGATIATGSFGPIAQRFGGIRDLVLGLEFVAGDGKIVRGGGRVVKNVAGFDLTRLLTGSWGTLGVITEATLRLYSREAQPATVLLALPGESARISQVMAALRTLPLAAHATELLSPATAAAIGLPARTSVLMRLGGNSAAVGSQLEALGSLGARPLDRAPWDTLRTLDGDRSSVLRMSALAGRLMELWERVRQATEAESNVLAHASVALGIVRCIVSPDADPGLIARIAAAGGDCSVVYERMPASMWRSLSPSVVADRLSQGIKRAFDPANILNPGILGE